MQDSNPSPVKFLRLVRVQEATGLGRSAIYDRLDRNSPRYDPTFPKQVRLSNSCPQRRGAVAFVEAEVQAWILDRVHASRENAQNDVLNPGSSNRKGALRETTSKGSLGLSRSSKHSQMGEGLLPPDAKAGASSRWSASKIDAWLEQQHIEGEQA
ncbi:helix-turn-helix transcriptional regulator [Hydrogenophaga taeniospiralis]|uniref:helix-turn-helix transcriptional regulator n=1 Tax=Hydrogenophaga taeniospiralis TaxID=65656 RepID=UPI001CFACFC3|nr:AlpA family phage regulatory protein [Hydrogenophaga taeniospiralis]UCU95201.1 AlpA family phage regulatory protein [Hydrogenophaga taeniospiralis]